MIIEETFKYSTQWYEDEQYNFYFLKSAERLMNDILSSRGYMYENQIYEILGIPWEPGKENRLFKAGGKYDIYPGRFTVEYYPGSTLLLVHDNNEEGS